MQRTVSVSALSATPREYPALKEPVESRGWLRFIIFAELPPATRIDELLDECDQLCRILGKSVATAKGKSRPRAAARPAATPISAS